MKYNINYGDKKTTRYFFIKELYSRYQQSHWGNTIDDNQLGSGLQSYPGSRLQSHIVFLPSDPDELVDQLKLLYFEKVAGNDSFLLKEQIIAIVDKLLEFECNTHSLLAPVISRQRKSIWNMVVKKQDLNS